MKVEFLELYSSNDVDVVRGSPLAPAAELVLFAQAQPLSHLPHCDWMAISSSTYLRTNYSRE